MNKLVILGATAASIALLGVTLSAQQNTIDVLDGETLFKGGWLFSTEFGLERREGLQRGHRRVPNPFRRRDITESVALSGHYGLRQDLQLSVILPYVRRERRQSGPAPNRLSAHGFGDASLIAKWRFYRWDADNQTINIALLLGLELPTGPFREKDGGVRLPPGLQPGSGSWDPSVGLAATYEPGRWRFNAAVQYTDNRQNSRDFRFGDEAFVELEAGNRFWLEPYPGPFMRFDVTARYYYQARGRQDGHLDHNTGEERITVGATLAFRPRPSLDFQIGGELPVYQVMKSTQTKQDFALFFAVGLRF